MVKTSRQPQDKYVLRLPDGMRDMLKEAAAENERSLNAEIVARLRSTLEGAGSDEDLVAAIKELVLSKRIADLFGEVIAGGVDDYALYVSRTDAWNEALEELLKWSLIDAGVLRPVEGETHPVSALPNARGVWVPTDPDHPARKLRRLFETEDGRVPDIDGVTFDSSAAKAPPEAPAQRKKRASPKKTKK